LGNSKRWFKIALFENEDAARRLCHKYFKDPRYEAHFVIEVRNGKSWDALYVNEEFYDLMNLF
jgi:hypothetical protein